MRLRWLRRRSLALQLLRRKAAAMVVAGLLPARPYAPPRRGRCRAALRAPVLAVEPLHKLRRRGPAMRSVPIQGPAGGAAMAPQAAWQPITGIACRLSGPRTSKRPHCWQNLCPWPSMSTAADLRCSSQILYLPGAGGARLSQCLARAPPGPITRRVWSPPRVGRLQHDVRRAAWHLQKRNGIGLCDGWCWRAPYTGTVATDTKYE
jgi:hypothetical protein